MTTHQDDFKFYIPTRIEFGINKIQKLADYAGLYGNRALLVTYNDQSLNGILKYCVAELARNGIASISFEEVYENPTFDIVDRGAAAARDHQCDFVVALGGGSVIDVAKGISVCATEEVVSIWEIVEGRELKNLPLPLIAIPTTSGTGSEVTQYAVISNREQKRKEGFGKTQFYPRLALRTPSFLPLGPTHPAYCPASPLPAGSCSLPPLFHCRADSYRRPLSLSMGLRQTPPAVRKYRPSFRRSVMRMSLPWASRWIWNTSGISCQTTNCCPPPTSWNWSRL